MERYLWEAIFRCDEWECFIYIINSLVMQYNPEDEVRRLREYLLGKYDKKKIKTALRVLDLDLKIIKGNKLVHNVLAFDLGSIADLIRDCGATPVFLTYPHNQFNSTILKTTKRLQVVVVDNEKIFSSIASTYKVKERFRKDFFVSDGHCNGRGYQIIAENVYNVITKNRLLERR